MKDVFVKQKVTARMAKCVRVDVMRTGWVEAPAEYALASEVLELRRRLARAIRGLKDCDRIGVHHSTLMLEKKELKQRRARRKPKTGTAQTILWNGPAGAVEIIIQKPKPERHRK